MRRRLLSWTTVGLAALLGSCAGPLIQPAPEAGARPPDAAAPPPPGHAGVPPRPAPPQACVRESEPCNPQGVACCAGLICVGTRGAFCITRF